MSHLQFRAGVFNSGWSTLALGGGGWLVGGDIAADGTTVARTDTYGAYYWTGSTWRQLVTSASMPVNTSPADYGPQGYGEGCYEIRIAPSNTQIFYMVYRGFLYYSPNRGSSWARTAFPRTFGQAPANDSYRMLGQKMAVNPSNPARVLVSLPGVGVRLTTDSGATWSTPTGISVVASPGYSIIWIDATTVLVSIYGVGVVKSTDSGATFSATTGPTTNMRHWQLTQGVVYGVENSATRNLWKYASSTWTDLGTPSSDSWHCPTVDTTDSTKIWLSAESGAMKYSSDSGATFGNYWYEGSPYSNMSRSATGDVTWLAATEETYKSSGGIIKNPATGNMVFFEGIGVWDSTAYTNPATQTWVWNARSRGIEQLVVNEIISPPGASSKPIVGVWDRGVFRIDDPATYPATHGISLSQGIVNAHGIDYASSDSDFICMVGLDLQHQTDNNSGYSTDGGATWSLFSSVPSVSIQGGSIAASTPTNMVYVCTNNVIGVYYTTDGGVNWTRCTIPDEPTSGLSGYGTAYYLKRKDVAADRVTANCFYLYNYLVGILKTTDGGANWSIVSNGGVATTYLLGNASSQFNGRLRTVPGAAGFLMYCQGPQGGDNIDDGQTHPAPTTYGYFYRSTDGGVTWDSVPNVLEVHDFGFGKQIGSGYNPTVYIIGYVNNVHGVWYSTDIDQATPTWTRIPVSGGYPLNSFDNLENISGDMNIARRVYIGWTGSGGAYIDF